LHYDPVKFHLAKLLGKSVFLRRAFHLALDLLFLRAWYVRRELKRIAVEAGIPQSSIRNPQFLDAGMGFGQYSDRMLRTFKGARLVGLEIDRAHLYGGERYFRKVHPAASLVIGDVQRLPLSGEEFDLVLTVDVMEHVGDDRAAFGEFYRVLRPGGVLVMHTPRVRRTTSPPPESPPAGSRGGSVGNPPLLPPATAGGEGSRWRVGEHVRDGYSDAEARERLEAAGFKIVRLVRDYGKAGRFAWALLQKIPITLLSRGRLMLLPVALYLITILPVALAAMWLDLIKGDHIDGGSLLVVAARPVER